MSTIRYTSLQGNKYGLVKGETREYTPQKNYSGLVLVVGLLIVLAIGIFIYSNWNSESLLLSFVLAYRIKHSDKWCIEHRVSTAKLLENDVLIFKQDGNFKHVENVVEIEIAE